MTPELVARLTDEMRYEYSRTAPPAGFPRFPDIPVGRFVSDEFWDLERRHLWTKVWVIAGRSEDAPNPGDFFTFDDLGSPMVLVRGNDGELRAFYNTCQHRGAPVVRDAKGSARLLRCQYHSWSYDIDDGHLVSVPDERDFVGLVKEERCLATVRCEVWDGWVFVNQDPQAVPLLEWLGPVARELDAPPRCAPWPGAARWCRATGRSRRRRSWRCTTSGTSIVGAVRACSTTAVP